MVGRTMNRAEQRRAAWQATVARVSYPEQLPVSARRHDLAEAIGAHQVVVVAGETGSGKTTQLPKICLQLGRGAEGMIAHTQPRRIAARTVAERIADELGVPLGGAVGYSVRFTDRTRADTLVRLMTDGLLLAEVQRDRLLRRYDTIIVDEAHERSLNIDFLLGYLARILPERPDLKLVITSATIDPERFARHFGEDVPVVEVSGRTYPVEVRYRPLTAESGAESDDDETEQIGPDRDPVDAIGDAVDELLGEGRGDVLVFLSGEREIRDTADALRGRFRETIDVLPLYARLSTGEQQRVFRPTKGGPPRVVLATNVAETSLTVPGIRYVVDPGTARISRYSPRLKVQRLPIERISQASADQRKGRCGRTSAGICIRLYGEEDFQARPRYTDPEILRTSLAAVILQMASVGLGGIEDFPFLDPPDRRQIRDGLNLLQELGAIDDERRLTPIGRRVAQLPVDPRLARMVVEADRLSCADEVMIIVAALSIQDPRERPSDKQGEADQLHARFADESSDFLAYLNLWRYLREQQHELSNSQFRKRCKAEHLHPLRVREWQDLVQQLRQAARGAKVTRNQTPAEPVQIHTALLSGLLSHLGLKDPRGREYLGARGAKFMVFPGSVLARKTPTWVMVAELVETSRLWGRTAARIDPAWVEPLAAHLVKRTYSEPRWERKRASVVATERVTLYGLPIVAGRAIDYGRIDPELSRELFIRRALVEGDWQTSHGFVEANREAIAEVEKLEHRTRRRDILVDDHALFEVFDARIPDDVVSGAHFDRWWREARRSTPDLLTFTPEVLVAPHARDALDPRAWPSQWKQGEAVLDLSYRFDPGAEDDGVTVHVPLRALGQLRSTGFDWLVPGLRTELVTTLLRGLPKELRRPLVPVPAVVEEVLEAVTPRSAPVLDALEGALARLRNVTVPHAAWDVGRLPSHLRMRFEVADDAGRVLASGRDLDVLRAELRPRLQAELTAAAARFERRGLTSWDGIGELPRTVALPGTGQTVRAYPALVDEGATAGVRMLETPEAQAASMAAGTRRLLLLGVGAVPVRDVTKGLPSAAQLALASAPHGSAAAVVEDATVAAVDALVASGGGPAWDAAGFERLRRHVAGGLLESVRAIVAQVVRVLDAEREVRRRLEALRAPSLREATMDVRQQLHRLVFDGFVAATGARRLADVERYLHGASRRLERLPDVVAADADRMRAVHELEELYGRTLDTWPQGRPMPAGLREIPWMLQELRVSQFAQGLGTRGPISSKRVRKVLEEAALAARS
jgi:ATP-dependent helicase HrpA